MSLLAAFSELKDPRRAQGMRFNLSQILTMTFLAYLCGYHSYRSIMKFCKSCQALLVDELALAHGIPSYVTFRDVLTRLDEQACITAFNVWALSYTSQLGEESVSVDGKSLRSTLRAYAESSQDFKAVVSAFGQTSGLVYQIGTYRNKKESEIEVVRKLITSLEGMGLLICGDALHCQKKL